MSPFVGEPFGGGAGLVHVAVACDPFNEPTCPERNGSEPVRIVNIHRPALKFESFFCEMHALIGQGKIKRLPPKEPRSAIYVAMLLGKYPSEIRVAKPPSGVFKALALVGKALGFKLDR